MLGETHMEARSCGNNVGNNSNGNGSSYSPMSIRSDRNASNKPDAFCKSKVSPLYLARLSPGGRYQHGLWCDAKPRRIPAIRKTGLNGVTLIHSLSRRGYITAPVLFWRLLILSSEVCLAVVILTAFTSFFLE